MVRIYLQTLRNHVNYVLVLIKIHRSLMKCSPARMFSFQKQSKADFAIL